VLAAGRLVQTNHKQVSANKIVFSLDNAQQIHSLAVFLTGVQPLPQGTGAAIHVSWPPYSSWDYLGIIANNKPSAIFKVTQQSVDQHIQAQNVILQLGIEIMEISALQHQYNTGQESNKLTVNDMSLFSKKMCESFFNYATSFSKDIYDNTGQKHAIIPANVVEKWYQNFENKIHNNPNFWKE